MCFLTLALTLYFLPTLLAGSRHHPDATGIALTNLLLGWTVVGWIVCLAWVLSEPTRSTAPTYLSPAAFVAATPYPAGWSAASAVASGPFCPACSRPVLPSGNFCSMCGATLYPGSV